MSSLDVTEFAKRTGLPRGTINYFRKSGLVDSVESTKGRRIVYVFPESQVEVAKQLSQVIKARSITAKEAKELIEGGLGKRSELKDRASGDELGAYLDAILRHQGQKADSAAKRFELWRDQLPSQEREAYGPPPNPFSLADALEGKTVSLKGTVNLAYLLGVHSVLLDPLFSSAEVDRSIVLNYKEDFIRVGDARDQEYGHNATYRIPARRLKGAEAVIGTVTLLPGGRSDIHSHPGDELMLCLRGKVVVRLEPSGMENVLEPGDFIHFDSDYTHWARNASDADALLFIIRFFQIDATKETEPAAHVGHWRGKVSAAIENLVAVKKTAGLGVIDKAAERCRSDVEKATEELKKALQMSSPRFQEADQIPDTLALGRFLKQFREMKKRKAPLDPSFEGLQPVEAGTEVVTRDQLMEIGKQYGIEPVLLNTYRSQAVPNAVAVRGLLASGHGTGQDFLPRGEADPEGRYYQPKWSLSNSDISVVGIDLVDRNESSVTNIHPGFELVLPLSGVVSVRFTDGHVSQKASAEAGEFVMYSSEHAHTVINDGRDRVRALVIRFSSRWGQPSE